MDVIRNTDPELQIARAGDAWTKYHGQYKL